MLATYDYRRNFKRLVFHLKPLILHVTNQKGQVTTCPYDCLSQSKSQYLNF